MGIMQAATSAGRRAEWLLDRIRRGQFADLDSLSIDDLRSLEQETTRAYEALPPSRETDRGRVMLLQGRVKLELRSRERAEPSGKGKPAARAKVPRAKMKPHLDQMGRALSDIERAYERQARANGKTPGDFKDRVTRAELAHIVCEHKRVLNASKTGRGRR